MLCLHVVHAERLAAVVQRAGHRAIDVGQRIALRNEVALLIQWAERFIADLVIKQHELTKVRAGSILNNRLPAALGGLRIPGAQRLQILRAFRFDHKRPEEAHHGQFAVVAVRMELAAPLLLRGRNIPFHVHGLSRSGNAVRIGGAGRLTRGRHHHAGAVNIETDLFRALQRIAERELDAITLVAAKDQRLNPLILQPVHHRARVVTFHVTSFFVLRFFRTNLVDVFRQHVHIAGIKIEPHVQRDLDVDRRDVVRAHRGSDRAASAANRHGLGGRIGHQKDVLITRTVLVHHVDVIVLAAGPLHLGVMYHLLVDLFHDALVLPLHHGRPLDVPFLGILDNGLPLELLRPSRLIVRRDMQVGRLRRRDVERPDADCREHRPQQILPGCPGPSLTVLLRPASYRSH